VCRRDDKCLNIKRVTDECIGTLVKSVPVLSGNIVIPVHLVYRYCLEIFLYRYTCEKCTGEVKFFSFQISIPVHLFKSVPVQLTYRYTYILTEIVFWVGEQCIREVIIRQKKIY
jgi:hypothetical protein